jgi:hypothetical protein
LGWVRDFRAIRVRIIAVEGVAKDDSLEKREFAGVFAGWHLCC